MSEEPHTHVLINENVNTNTAPVKAVSTTASVKYRTPSDHDSRHKNLQARRYKRSNEFLIKDTNDPASDSDEWSDKGRAYHDAQTQHPPGTMSAMKPSTTQKILDLVQYSINDSLDPFAAMPAPLDKHEEHLITFYLLYYPKATYGLSSHLKPHPVATNFSIALNAPACFQVILARAALYRLNLGKFVGQQERKSLEVSMMRHKGEAIRIIRGLSTLVASSTKTDQLAVGYNERSSTAEAKTRENLIASVISLGTLDKRTGSDGSAAMHFMAVRKMLRAAGGPSGIQSVLLSRVMCHFECIYGTTTLSYVYDYQYDFARLLKEFNKFMAHVWSFWVSLSAVQDAQMIMNTDYPQYMDQYADMQSYRRGSYPSIPSSTSGSPPSRHRTQHTLESISISIMSPLRSALRTICPDLPADATEPAQQQLTLQTFSMATLLTLMHIMLDYSMSHPAALQTYLGTLHAALEKAGLEKQPTNNHCWMLQVHDHSAAHSRRIWRVAGWIWVMKFAPWRVRWAVGEWVSAFLEGKNVKDGVEVDWFKVGRRYSVCSDRDSIGTVKTRISGDENKTRREASSESHIKRESIDDYGLAGQDVSKEQTRSGSGESVTDDFAPQGPQKRRRMRLEAFHFSYAS